MVLFLVTAVTARQAEAVPMLMAGAGGLADGWLSSGFIADNGAKDGNAFLTEGIRGQEPAGRLGPLSYYDVRVERSGRRDLPDVLLRYPSFGVSAVDRDIALWCGHLASSFERDFDRGAFGGGDGAGPESWLSAGYAVLSASQLAASIVFDVWMCTGSGALSEDVLTLSYNMITGQRLHLVDIFENPDAALRILSERTREALAGRVGGGRVDAVIAAGTAPEPENFASIALTPLGVRVYFQPYQVTRYGDSQTVDVSLDALMPAGPMQALWGR